MPISWSQIMWNIRQWGGLMRLKEKDISFWESLLPHKAKRKKYHRILTIHRLYYGYEWEWKIESCKFIFFPVINSSFGISRVFAQSTIFLWLLEVITLNEAWNINWLSRRLIWYGLHHWIKPFENFTEDTIVILVVMRVGKSTNELFTFYI